MTLFQRLKAQFDLGCRFNRGVFHARLDIIARAAFKGAEVSALERQVWERPGVQQYWNNDVAHLWVAIATQGMGRSKLGVMKRADALRALSNAIPKSAVLHIDDANHFLFYKLVE